MTTLAKTYEPHAIEKHWYQTWEKAHYFAPSMKGDPYAITLPPPNVTGSLHMGHGFGSTLMDILIRYHRMMGMNTLWQPGTDHAGIATQMVVERQLNQQGTARKDLGREAFLEKVWTWKEESGSNITRQLRRLGTSLDWERECFTLDENPSRAVREVFIQLYEEGLIYRGTRLVNWDPQMGTAVSDLEVVSEETTGKLWHIRYPLKNSKDYLVVATTRPETMLGDVAVAVHPEDERYQALIGQDILLPLTERTIKIIADESVDKTFGTGCVKITPAHDFNDYAMGLRHGLSSINIFTPTAHLNENTPQKYQGLERFKAREQILADLTVQGLLEKIDNHQLKIPRGEKSGAIIEPMITQQWFMKMTSLAKPAIDAVQNKNVRFIPEQWEKTYFQWMNNIQDWCISRQLWWGHRIPIWYDAHQNAYAGHDEQDVRSRHHLSADVILKQDEDVLDTWFSAALWPFTTLGWPEETRYFKAFLPNQVLVTGFDIIFFWVARMIMMSLKFTKQVPFRDVYITGLIRDSEGQKMSKSKGNVLDPIDLIDGISLEALIQKRTYGLMQPKMAEKIEKNTKKEFKDGIPSYGTDALRFTFCSLASYTREIRFDINRLAGYRNFCNKLWNAARYVLMHIENVNFDEQKEYSPCDLWIKSRLQKTITDAHEALKQYRFDLFAQSLYDFVWNEFCDWYLELSKPILNNTQNPRLILGTKETLSTVLQTILRLLHPIMPFITEEIWQRIRNDSTSIMLAAYPTIEKNAIYPEIEEKFTYLKNIITTIRTLRSEMNMSPSQRILLSLKKGTEKDQALIQEFLESLKSLAKLENILWLNENETLEHAASAFIGELEIFVPFAKSGNIQEEISRLQKESIKLNQDLILIQKKLDNADFINRAPAQVVQKEKARLEEINLALLKINKQLEQYQNPPKGIAGKMLKKG